MKTQEEREDSQRQTGDRDQPKMPSDGGVCASANGGWPQNVEPPADVSEQRNSERHTKHNKGPILTEDNSQSAVRPEQLLGKLDQAKRSPNKNESSIKPSHTGKN